jgi:hypothetical protein
VCLLDLPRAPKFGLVHCRDFSGKNFHGLDGHSPGAPPFRTVRGGIPACVTSPESCLEGLRKLSITSRCGFRKFWRVGSRGNRVDFLFHDVLLWCPSPARTGSSRDAAVPPCGLGFSKAWESVGTKPLRQPRTRRRPGASFRRVRRAIPRPGCFPAGPASVSRGSLMLAACGAGRRRAARTPSRLALIVKLEWLRNGGQLRVR